MKKKANKITRKEEEERQRKGEAEEEVVFEYLWEKSMTNTCLIFIMLRGFFSTFLWPGANTTIHFPLIFLLLFKIEIGASSASSSHGHELAFLTPPSSSEECAKTNLEVALSKNTSFLHSLAALSSLSKDETSAQIGSKSSETIVKSVQTAVNFVLDRRRGRCANVSQRMFQEAGNAIVRTVDARVAEGCREEIVAMVTKLAENLLDGILENSEICNVSFSEYK